MNPELIREWGFLFFFDGNVKREMHGVDGRGHGKERKIKRGKGLMDQQEIGQRDKEAGKKKQRRENKEMMEKAKQK